MSVQLASSSMPSSPNIPRRSVSNRRGSVSASDPWAKNAHLACESTSTLTIVRVHHEPPTTPSSPGNMESASPRRLHQQHRRKGSNPSSPVPTHEPQSTRLSFAFSSFGPSSNGNNNNIPANAGTTTPSPSSSPRLRPSSPGPLHRLPPSSLAKPRLTPDQLVDLARHSTTNLARSPAQIGYGYVPPSSSTTSAGSSPIVHPSSSPLLRSQSPTITRSASHDLNGQTQHQSVQPATFTPLPPHVYLPFIDRPAEVATLLSFAPTKKLFALLAQTFSGHRSASPQNETTDGVALPADPTSWTLTHLTTWLTCIPRSAAPDAVWVARARRCVMSHSELIWERLAGALGVPPELNEDDDDAFLDWEEDAVEDEEGQSGWEDWEAVDSPTAEPNTTTSPPATSTLDAPAVEAPLIHTQNPTPPIAHETDPFLGSSPALAPSNPPSLLTIEPLVPALTPASSFSALVNTGSPNPPPLSLPSSLALGATVEGLGDIREDEEDAEGDAAENKNVKEAEAEAEAEAEMPQIHGLRISTSTGASTFSSPAISPTIAAAPSLMRRSGSFGSTSAGASKLGTGIHRTGSFGSVPSGGLNLGAWRRSNSSGALERSVFATRSPPVRGGGAVHFDFDGEGGYAYDPVADRAPGNPLFPSNFARLALGPTLVANNPSLRSPLHPPASAYSRRRLSATSIGRGNRFSRGDSGNMSDYAITLRSESADGSRGGDA